MTDVPVAERNDLLKEKLAMCAVVYDFAEAETPERDQKRQILLGAPAFPCRLVPHLRCSAERLPQLSGGTGCRARGALG